MVARRLFVVLASLTIVCGLAAALFQVLALGGWTFAKALMVLGFVGAAPWVGLCFTNGAVGFAILVFGRPVAVPLPPPGSLPPVAIALTVRNEAMTEVLPNMATLLQELDALGHGDAFTLFVLSDTQEPTAVALEEAAVVRFRAESPRPDRIRYRRRVENTAFKAGNIMDFLDNHAGDHELMLTLDADSRMTAPAVLCMIAPMLAEPKLGIVQHLTVALPATSVFPRLFQFGMRAGLRTWATALTWWQGDEACYWGHNAVIRCKPFRDHCRLPLLPGGAHILSHDQVEAAMLTGAGWGVRLLASEDGSYETNPPALPEHLRRELRWLAGNFEYRHLLSMSILRPMGRWQLLQAILLFGSTPFYLVFLAGAALAAAMDRVSAFPFWPALALTLGWTGALYTPKILGYLEVALSARKRAAYGGLTRLIQGACLETCFTLLYDAVGVFSKTLATARILLGARSGWSPQNRDDRGVGWMEALRLLWPHTLAGLIAMAAFAQAGWVAVFWALPLIGGLPLAVPFCVLTACPAFGEWLRRAGLAATPEEIARSRA